jgi:hypothetical protein
MYGFGLGNDSKGVNERELSSFLPFGFLRKETVKTISSENENIYYYRLNETQDDYDTTTTNNDISFLGFGFS